MAELDALRDALAGGLGVSSAVSAARDAISSGGRTLGPSLAGYRGVDADLAMERALAVTTVEQSVTGLLLPALGRHRPPRRHDEHDVGVRRALGGGLARPHPAPDAERADRRRGA